MKKNKGTYEGTLIIKMFDEFYEFLAQKLDNVMQISADV